MESRKEVRQKQIEERAQREKERAERDKEEKLRREEEEMKKKALEEEKKKDALAAMSMNYGGYLAKRQEQARNKRGGADKEKKKKILAERRKPLNIDHMDNQKLREKAQELWKWLVQLENEKYDTEVQYAMNSYLVKQSRNRYNDNQGAK